MNGKQTLYVMLLHGGVAVAVIFGATLLAFHGSLDSPTVAVIYGAALGLAGGSASAVAAVGSAINGKNTVSSDVLASHETTLRQAIATNIPASPAAPVAPVEPVPAPEQP